MIGGPEQTVDSGPEQKSLIPAQNKKPLIPDQNKPLTRRPRTSSPTRTHS